MPVLGGRVSISKQSKALHQPLKIRVCSQFPIERSIPRVQAAIKCALPLPSERCVFSQMGVRGIPRYVGSLAREDHLRIPAKRRKKRFPPRECPWH
jgi:hypothetical protein